MDPPDPTSGARFRDALGRGLLVVAVLFNAWLLWPETRIGRTPINDNAFHQALSERLVETVERGDNPLDPWVSQFALGYPVWRTYQPLAHWLSALVVGLSSPVAEAAASQAFLLWLLLCLVPPAFYLAARGFELGRFEAGFAALLALALSSTGEYGRFGLSYGAFVWRGSGLLTQLLAVPLLVLALAAAYRALRTGRRLTRAALLIGLTALAHVIFGYAAGLSACVLALVIPSAPGRQAPRRLVRLAWMGAATVVLTSFLVLPALLHAPLTNHSRWEAAWKWDSFGAEAILAELIHGRLLDAGRPPVLTLLLALGTVTALLHLRRPALRALLALTLFWLVLFFGRETWGTLTRLILVPDDLHMHRFQGVFEACAVLLAAAGAGRILELVSRRRSLAVQAAASAVLLVLLLPALWERASYLRENALMGETHARAWDETRAERERVGAALDELLEERPGRGFAGLRAQWGGSFTIGNAAVDNLLLEEGIDTVSFLWHAMSLTSDAMVVIDDRRTSHLRAMGIRALLSPPDREAFPGTEERLRGDHITLREVTGPESGFFALSRAPIACEAPTDTFYRCAQAWLASGLPEAGVTAILPPPRSAGFPEDEEAVLTPDELRRMRPAAIRHPGRVLREERRGETYLAEVEVPKGWIVVFRMTWHPGWTVELDGRPDRQVRTFPVTPGYVAFAVPEGRHRVRLLWRPSRLKTALFLVGLFLLPAIGLAERRGLARWIERRALALTAAGRRLWSRAMSLRARRWLRVHGGPLLLVAGLAVVCLRPSFSGTLVEGHDIHGYPVRQVEFHENVRRGILLPLWAPDMGAGHGQPHFAFAPPLFYWAAEIFLLAGLPLAASLNAAVILLGLLGAWGMYLAGAWLTQRWGGIVAAGGFLLSGYFLTELYVRAAYMEYAGLCLLPWAFLAFVRLLDRPSVSRAAWAAGALALTALTHNAVLLMAVPALALTGLLHAVARGRIHPVLWGAVAGIWGLALSAWMWLPTLAEISHAHLDRLLERHTRWEHHFLALFQLFREDWGHGFSVPGPGDGMSYALGWPLLVGGALGAATLWGWRRGARPARRATGLAAALLVLVGWFFCLEGSRPLYELVASLRYLQFPWRFLVLGGVFLPLTAALAVPLGARLRRLHPGVPGRRICAGLLLGLLLVHGLPRTRPAGRVELDESRTTPEAIARLGLNATTFEEYEPIWVETRPAWMPRPFRVDVPPGEGISSRDLTLEIDTLEERPNRRLYRVNAPEAVTLRSDLFYYPGWKARIDGEPVEIRPGEGDGLIRMRIPSGTHTVELSLEATPLRRAARALSLAALLALLAPLLGAGRLLRKKEDS